MEDNETQEEETKQETKEEPAPEGEAAGDTGEGKPVEAKSKIEEAEELAERIDKGNKVMSENIARLEKLKADDMLSGKAYAGQAPEKTKEMSEEEYSEALLDGKIPLKDE